MIPSLGGLEGDHSTTTNPESPEDEGEEGRGGEHAGGRAGDVWVF